MNKSKVYSYIIALGIALLITEFGNRLGDYITKEWSSNWALLLIVFIVTAMFTIGYLIIDSVDKLLLKQEKEGSKTKFSKPVFYLILFAFAILVVLAQSAINLSN